MRNDAYVLIASPFGKLGDLYGKWQQQDIISDCYKKLKIEIISCHVTITVYLWGQLYIHISKIIKSIYDIFWLLYMLVALSNRFFSFWFPLNFVCAIVDIKALYTTLTLRAYSYLPGVACMRHWIGLTLVQIMACRLFGTKPLSKPMLGYCLLDT